MKPREPGVYTYKGQTAVVRRDPVEGLLYFTMSGSGRICPTNERDWEDIEVDGEDDGLLRFRDIQKLHIEEGDAVIVTLDDGVDVPDHILREEFLSMVRDLKIKEVGAEIHLVSKEITFSLVKEQDKDTDPTIQNLRDGRDDALEEGRLEVTRETEPDGIVSRVADIRGDDEFHEGFEDGVCVLNPSSFENTIKIETKYFPEYLQSLAEHEPDFMDGKMYFVLVTREKEFADHYISRIRTMIGIAKSKFGIDFQNDLVVVSATESKDLIGLNIVGAFVTPNVAHPKEVIEIVQRRVRARMARFQ